MQMQWSRKFSKSYALALKDRKLVIIRKAYADTMVHNRSVLIGLISL